MRFGWIEVTDNLSLDDNELEFRYVRSRGPGGQHVNKASTAVQLRFDVANSESLPERVKKRLLRVARTYATQDGVIILFADSHRSQLRNKDDAVDRLVELIEVASRPVKRRRKTKPTASSVQRRIERKKRRGQLKKDRRWNLDG